MKSYCVRIPYTASVVFNVNADSAIEAIAIAEKRDVKICALCGRTLTLEYPDVTLEPSVTCLDDDIDDINLDDY